LSAGDPDGFREEFGDDLEAAERRVAGEFDPGARALVVAVLVFLLVGTFILPHTGAANGWEVLAGGADAAAERVGLPSRIFVWLTLVFAVGTSMLALLTRRWAVAWLALAGTTVAGAAGMFAVWSRQTVGDAAGPGIGLVLAWLLVLVLIFQWARLVWTRTAAQLAAEEQRRHEAAERDRGGPLDDPGT